MELFGEVLATVAASDRPLTKSELDAALGIRH
jgi:DNA-binding transcriptional regulator GbsR (MarR family)